MLIFFVGLVSPNTKSLLFKSFIIIVIEVKVVIHLAHDFWGLGFRKAAPQITDRGYDKDRVVLCWHLL